MNRRSFLRTTGALTGAAGLGIASGGDLASAVAAPRTALPNTPTNGGSFRLHVDPKREQIQSTLTLWTPAAGEWNTHTIGHLYRRAGFGATLQEIAAAANLTPSALIDTLLDDKLTASPNRPAPPPHRAEWKAPSAYSNDLAGQQQLQSDYYNADYALRRWWAQSMSEPKTMLREKMVYFWANHFVVEAQKVFYPFLLEDYIDYFRQHPWGNLKQMVKDVTIMPAMLLYLDGASSLRTQPNENYARELMELFTLGVVDKDGNPNYTEGDIHEVAKALTGYQLNYSGSDPNAPIEAFYNVNNHDATYKTPFASAGAPKRPYGLASSGKVTDDIIDALFQYKGEQLAYFICGKLYQFFVYHDISGDAEKAIIAELARTLVYENWELKMVLNELLKSEHFFDEANIGAAIKSPFEYLVGLTRQLNVPIDLMNAGTFYGLGVALDQSLLDPPNVKGWIGYRSWVSTTTLPLRNQVGYAMASGTSIPAAILGSDSGDTYTPIVWTNDLVAAWGAKFTDYDGDINAFIGEVAQYLCATPPPDSILSSVVRAALQFQDYEWPAMQSTQKLAAVRTIVSALVQLPEFQLM